MEIVQDVAISVNHHQSITNQSQILSRLSAEIGQGLVDMWFASADCFEIHEDSIIVNAHSEFELRRIQRGYASHIRRIAADVLGRPMRIEFRVIESGVHQDSTPRLATAKGLSIVDSDGQKKQRGETDGPGGQLTGTYPLNRRSASGNIAGEGTRSTARSRPARPTLAEFAFGAENQFAMVAVQQILASPAQFSPFLVHGGSGAGKSHLLEALTLELRRKWKFASCIYLTAEQFTSHFLQSLRGDGLPVFRRKYRDVDVIAIDDIQFFANKRATISEFQYTLDHLVRAGKQILLSSDRSPLELFDLGSEIVNRINAGLVCPLQFAESESRHRIARRFCRERSLDWPDELLAVLAERVGKDGRRVSGVINQLCAASFVRQRVVDMEMLDEILPEQSPMMRRSTIQAVEKALCELFGVSVKEIRSANRSRKVSMARTLAMFFCRRHTECALSEIGEHFGGRSHSTVIAAIHRVDQMIEAQEEIPLMMGSCPIGTLMANVENKLHCH